MSNRWGTFCNPQEAAQSMVNNAPITCLTRGESIGLAFIGQAGGISLLSLIIAFALIIRNMIRGRRGMVRRKLIKVPADLFLLSLLIGEFFLSIAMTININWVHEGKVHTCPTCRAQSIFTSLGAVISSMTNIAITINTFSLVWWERGRSLLGAWIVIALIWIYAFVFVLVTAVTHGVDNVYRPSPYWCSFGKVFIAEKLVGEYLWMWSALTISILLYTPLALWRAGHITLHPGVWWKFSFHRKAKTILDTQRRRSLDMIFYPLVYGITVLPSSVVRWVGFYEELTGSRVSRVPDTVVLTARFFFGLSGAANVILFLLTRPRLLLFPMHRQSTATLLSPLSPRSDFSDDRNDRVFFPSRKRPDSEQGSSKAMRDLPQLLPP